MAWDSKDDRIDEDYEKANLKGDKLNFVLLTCLYLLQGTARGIAYTIPTIVQKRGVTYEEQGVYNFVWYSNIMKILWAPIVDSVYSKRIGRRKTWFLMAEMCTGAVLFFLSMNSENWLGTENGRRKPDIRRLTAAFFVCNLSNSIQDIAVDGWSLTMLQRKNVAYAAVCQSTGLAIGHYAIPAGLIILESKDFGNTMRSVFGSVPRNYGLVSFSQLFLLFSLVIAISTTLIVIFKKEVMYGREYPSKVDDDDHCWLSMKEAYVLVWKILKKRSMRMLILLAITISISVAPLQSVATLKLLDNGISRDTLATINLLIFPLQLALPYILNRCLTGRHQLSLTFFFYVLRLVNGCAYATYIFLIAHWKNEFNVLPTWYYGPLLIIRSLDATSVTIVVVTESAFFARISDPKFGGVYLTLLYSMMNLGDFAFNSMCFWSVNFLTITSCSDDGTSQTPVCHTVIDGFHVQVVVLIFGRSFVDVLGKKNNKLPRENERHCIQSETEPDQPTVIDVCGTASAPAQQEWKIQKLTQ